MKLIQRIANRLNNVAGAKSIYSANTNYENAFRTNKDRYVDPLIRDNINKIDIPLHRERVAMEDPVASMFLWDFNFEGYAKYPKFYASDEIDAPEIMQDARALMMSMGFKKPAIIAGSLKQIHGWQTSIFEGMPDMELNYTIFSEHQCRPQQMMRQFQKVLSWRVVLRPRLPYNRIIPDVNLYQTTIPNDPKAKNIIYDTRGDEKSSFGFGYPRMEKMFDSLTKLRMDSDADSFRKAIFPMSIYPPDWEEITVDKYFEKMSNLSRTTAVAYPAAKDKDGKLYDTIPNLTWMSPTDNVKQTGSGQFGGLSVEWIRLLAAVKHSMGYLTGGGAISSSQAAAGVDVDDDLKSDIYEWNLVHQSYIKKFLDWIKTMNIIDIPEVYTIKSHWQWEHDEIMMQQNLTQQLELENTQETHKKDIAEQKQNYLVLNAIAAGFAGRGDHVKPRPKWTYDDLKYGSPADKSILGGFSQSDVLKRWEKRKDKPIGDVVSTLGKRKEYKDKLTTLGLESIDPNFTVSGEEPMPQQHKDPEIFMKPANSQYSMTTGLEAQPYKGDPSGMGWQPVQSASGNVTKAAFTDKDTILVDFKGKTYEYSDKDGSITGRGIKMKDVFDRILSEGGESVWEYLRAPLSIRASKIIARQEDPKGYAKGKYRAPKGKKGVPYTDDAHYATYSKTTKEPPSRQATGDIMGREKELITKGIKGTQKKPYVSPQMGMIGRLRNFLKPKQNNWDSRHPILQRYNSISEAARQMHHSKTTIHKMLDLEQIDQLRTNLMHMGNSFSTENPFVYVNKNSPFGYQTEYQDPKSIEKLIGNKVPIFVDPLHDTRREEETGLPPKMDWVGTYEITGFDKTSGIETAVYDIDYKKVNKYFERANLFNWIEPLRLNGKLPETSTEYMCNVKYSRERGIFIQSGFKLRGLALVKHGNCAGSFCSLTET
jgi:hypothetical protein